MSDTEPRRSVRSTKGQHKSLDQLDQPLEAKKKGRKTGKKLDDSNAEEEIIRCVCGATEQDGDPAEPWIACDRCTAWQHNVCMGMSVYSEDLAKDYFCEQCKPENHRELLEGMARGEKPWEERRRLYEEEKASGKKRKGGRKAKGKRNSDAKDGSAKLSPNPEARRESRSLPGTKRKARADSEDQDVKQSSSQRRKALGGEPMPVYNPPSDLPSRIADLPEARQTPAKGLSRAMTEVLGAMEKRGEFVPTSRASAESTAERFAIQIERAVHDAHQNHKEYGAQIRTLRFNLKENQDLCARLLEGSLIPPMLATMTSDALASRELQQKTAKMKAQAERQSILETEDDNAPRLRRTHKGEELVEKDDLTVVNEDKPSALRRQSVRDGSDSAAASSDSAKRAPPPETAQRQASEAKSGRKEFDIKKVFSSVRSPTNAHQRRPSQPLFPLDGPGVDPDVDRLLQDDGGESPPYSPTEESDPDVVWRGNIAMNGIAHFQATARHVGGVNLSTTIGLPWTTLVPKTLTVAGRIEEQKATEYLCGLRYSLPTDISVASLSPATDAAKAGFLALIDYFTQRKRYGVVAERSLENVRDTYLVPVPAGNASHPEFMLNLEDNLIPASRAAPMLLLVVVYRNDAAAMEKLRGPNWASSALTSLSPTLPPGGRSRNASMSAPAFSPTVPQAPTMAQPRPPLVPSQQQQQQQPPPPPLTSRPAAPQPAAVTPVLGMAAPASAQEAAAREKALRDGEAAAREILGPFASCSAAGFLMTQAAKMQKREWYIVRQVFERIPQSQDDLTLLQQELEKFNDQDRAAPPAKSSQTPIPIPRVPHTAAVPPRATPSAAPRTQPSAAPL